MMVWLGLLILAIILSVFLSDDSQLVEAIWSAVAFSFIGQIILGLVVVCWYAFFPVIIWKIIFGLGEPSFGSLPKHSYKP